MSARRTVAHDLAKLRMLKPFPYWTLAFSRRNVSPTASS